ncbi:MAG: ABC transporter permease [Lewinellaceae bacterium]|nr:hypothetical protein [Saprospiraceae bacterium]MCB9336554.1 ABC transporter permease [Lewinellaceae bacterium]
MNPIRHYFQLQFTMLNRHISEFGLPPWLGYLLSGVLFVGLSFYLYYQTGYAPYLLLFWAFGFMANMGDRNRNDFLKSCYKAPEYRAIRLLENGIIALPFLMVLSIKGDYWVALAVIAATLILAFRQIGRGSNYTLPTPFHRWPFEFAVGFRKTFIFHILAYFLAFMAVKSGNFNLGIFSLVLVFVICLTYYQDMEVAYYVWAHAQQPKVFLWNKIRTGLFYSTILSLPIAATLCLLKPGYWHIILVCQILGYAYLATVVLAKYSAFPKNIGLPQGVLLAMCFLLPPLLLLAAGWFYRQSAKKLQTILP